ncbi:hypothetical protein GLOIN_2v1650244, partial [Rhizophagus irregularis DAOM 181602=DAOM 197198]
TNIMNQNDNYLNLLRNIVKRLDILNRDYLTIIILTCSLKIINIILIILLLKQIFMIIMLFIM